MVYTFCRTPGEHHCVLPKSENSTANSSSNWCHSAPIQPPLTPLTPLISLSLAESAGAFFRSRRLSMPGTRAPVAMPPCPLLWRRPSRRHLAQRRTLSLHLSPLSLLEATKPSRSPRSRVLARASARRAPWPTMDGADARLELHCFPRPPDHLSRTYDLPATARTCRSHPSLTPASPAPRPRRAGARL